MMLQKVKSFLSAELAQFQWKELFKPSKKRTNICRVCNEEIGCDNFRSIFHENLTICGSCYRKFHLINERFYVGNVWARVLFDYDEHMKDMIFQFKACFDYELHSTFLEFLSSDLRREYHDYIVVPAPSSKEGNETRGFNHVVAIFSNLKIPIYPLFEKTANISQKELNRKERAKIGNILKLNYGEKLTGRNVLLVDDVMTTGSTIKAMLKMIKPYHPNKIKILVLSGKHRETKQKKRHSKI